MTKRSSAKRLVKKRSKIGGGKNTKDNKNPKYQLKENIQKNRRDLDFLEKIKII